jgi:hypothetical protein
MAAARLSYSPFVVADYRGYLIDQNARKNRSFVRFHEPRSHWPQRLRFTARFLADFRPPFRQIGCWPAGIPFEAMENDLIADGWGHFTATITLFKPVAFRERRE